MISYFKLSTEITFLEWLLLFFLILINFIFLTAWNWYHLFILAQNYFIIQETAISGNIWGVCYKSIWGRKSFIIVDNFNITVVGIGDGDRVCYWSGFSCVCFFFFLLLLVSTLLRIHLSWRLNVCFNKEFNRWLLVIWSHLLTREQYLKQWVADKVSWVLHLRVNNMYMWSWYLAFERVYFCKLWLCNIDNFFNWIIFEVLKFFSEIEIDSTTLSALYLGICRNTIL